MVTDLLSLPGLRVPEKKLCLQALDLYVDKNISFADAYNAAFMRSHHLTDIYSWDSEFDRMSDLHRMQPGASTLIPADGGTQGSG